MNVYQIWFNLADGADEADFAKALATFLDHLKQEDAIAQWRLLRCKLGLRPDHMTDFHLLIETHDLAQLDRAFRLLAARSGKADQLHFTANAVARDVRFGLYRDWPDA